MAAMCRSHKNSAVRSPDGRPGAFIVGSIRQLGALGRVGRGLVPLRPTGAHQQHVSGFERRPLRVERAEDVVGFDHVGLGILQRPALRRPPAADIAQHGTSGDAAPGPVIDAVILVGNAVVEAVGNVLDVAEAVPLRRRLRVPLVQQIVVAGRAIEHLVHVPRPPEQRRVRQIGRPVEGEHRTAVTSRAAATNFSGVIRLRQPK